MFRVLKCGISGQGLKDCLGFRVVWDFGSGHNSPHIHIRPHPIQPHLIQPHRNQEILFRASKLAQRAAVELSDKHYVRSRANLMLLGQTTVKNLSPVQMAAALGALPSVS